MSYQVGFSCFDTLQSAGVAACTNFEPVTTLTSSGSGNNVQTTVTTVHCNGVNVNGDLLLHALAVTNSGGSTSSTFTMPLTYQPCLYPQFVDAGLLIFVALLGVWSMIWGYKKIIDLLNWSRGDSQ